MSALDKKCIAFSATQPRRNNALWKDLHPSFWEERNTAFSHGVSFSTLEVSYQQRRKRTVFGSSIRENEFAIFSESSSFDSPPSVKKEDDSFFLNNPNCFQGPFSWSQVISKVLSTSFLIAGNTVGASMMQLPNAVSQAGVGASALIFLGSYLINLISALYLIDFSISQYESGRPTSELPTSFKDIADEAFGPSIGYGVAFVSVMFNWCALIFSILSCGTAAHTLVPEWNPVQVSLLFSAVLTFVHIQLSNNALSQMASVSVLALFASFAGLLIPGMMHSDFSTLIESTVASTSASTNDALLLAGPCIVFSMVFQNVIPIAAKLCNFDRFQTTASVVLGSALPTIMYMLWCAVVLAGGVDTSSVNSGVLLPIFMFAAVSGSSVGGVMSTAEEFESLLEPVFKINNESQNVDDSDALIVADKDEQQFFSVPSVLLATIPPALACVFLGSTDVSNGGGVMTALDIAGGYCSPFLCWLFPALLHGKLLQSTARNDIQRKRNIFDNWGSVSVSSVYVVLCSIFMLEQQFMKDVGIFTNHNVLTSLIPGS